MADGGIRKLQQEAAACTDELLDISRDISDEVLPLYTGTDRTMCELQCRLQKKRCKQVCTRLEAVRDALEEILSVPAGDTDDPAEAERRSSARVTLQIIAQNLVIAQQKQLLLQDLLISSGQAKNDLKAAEKLRNTAEIAGLQKALRETLGQI